MGTNILILLAYLLNFDQIALLFVDAYRLARILVGFLAFLESSIVEFPATIKHPLEFLSAGFIGINPVLVRFEHASLLPVFSPVPDVPILPPLRAWFRRYKPQ